MDCNGEVAPADLAALLGSWGQSPGYPADVNGDGEVRPKHARCFTWEDGRHDRTDWVTNEFARAVKRAGIAHCSLHHLRRSSSTPARRAGIDKATVKDLGGWSTIGVVEKHYTGEVPEVAQRAIAKLGAAQEVA